MLNTNKHERGTDTNNATAATTPTARPSQSDARTNMILKPSEAGGGHGRREHERQRKDDEQRERERAGRTPPSCTFSYDGAEVRFDNDGGRRNAETNFEFLKRGGAELVVMSSTATRFRAGFLMQF